MLLTIAMTALPAQSAPGEGPAKTATKAATGKTKQKPAPAPPKPAPAPRTPSLARDPYLGAIVVNAGDGRVLFEDHADAKGYPASVLKLMLLLTTMEQIEAGKLTLQSEVSISANAVSDEGADLDLREGEVYNVEDMLYALMIHSANDAAVAMAEKLGGSVAGYLKFINRRALELGMVNSHFHSPNGLGPKNPADPYDVTTPRDLSLLCREILQHPEALKFTSAREWIFRPDGGKRKVILETHNYILDSVKGCDGLKTGYIRAAGYCIAGTAKRMNQRVIAVLLGAPSKKARNKTAGKLLDRGFAVLGERKE